jgi:chromate transporter
LIDKRDWVRPEAFMLCFALARLTPGASLLAFCTGIGWLLRGGAGALIALLAASIPCTLVVVIATALFSFWQDNRWMQAAIHGAIAAAIAITASASWTIVQPYLAGARIRVALIAVTAALAFLWLHVPPIEVLLAAGAIGAFLPSARA